MLKTGALNVKYDMIGRINHLSRANLSRKLSLACCTDIWQPFHLNIVIGEVSGGFIDSLTVYSLFAIAEMHRERLLESQCRSIKAKVWATLPSISFFFLISTLETFPNLKSQIKFSFKR